MRQPWENLTKEKVIVILVREIMIVLIFGSISYVLKRKNLEDATMCFMGIEIFRLWPRYMIWCYSRICGKDENGNIKKVALSDITWKQGVLIILFGISIGIMFMCGLIALGAGNLKDGETVFVGIILIYIYIRLWIWRALHETPEQRMMRKIYEKIGKDKK